LVAARVGEAAELFGHAEPVALPFPDGTYPEFSFEAAEVHRVLYADQRDRYSPNLRAKLDAAVLLTEEEAAVAARLRGLYREQLAEIAAGYDLLVTPTLEWVAPPS